MEPQLRSTDFPSALLEWAGSREQMKAFVDGAVHPPLGQERHRKEMGESTGFPDSTDSRRMRLLPFYDSLFLSEV